MFRLWNRNGPRPSENFYRNFFALLTFVAFGIAFFTKSPIALLATLLFGTLSRTAVKKGWRNPWFADFIPYSYRKPKEEEPQESEEEAEESDKLPK